MRILFSSNVYPTKQYSLQAYVGVLCEELTRQGHEVVVVAPQLVLSCLRHNIDLVPQHYTEIIETKEGSKKIEIYRPRVYSIGASRSMRLEAWLLERAVSGTAKKIGRDFDLIYCQFWSSARNILPYAEENSIPVFVDCGEDVIWPKTFINEDVKNRIIKCTRGVVCVSSKNRDECDSLKLAKPEDCVVLPNAVNQKEFYKIDKYEVRKSLGIPEDSFIISFCGRFNHRKGVERLAEALKLCQGVHSIFIGRPSEDSNYLPDCPEILFCGSLPHDRIGTYLNASDVYVLPTLAEGCSNSIIEAMACGLPIISSDLPFNHDVLDASNAILIDPMDIIQIKNAIIKLRDDVILRKSMSESSLTKVQKLTIENRARSIVEFVSNRL